MGVKLYNGDCIEVMKSIPNKSIDAIITDPHMEQQNVNGIALFPLNLCGNNYIE